MAAQSLTPTQQSAISHARKHDGVLIRQPGGFWVGQYDRENRIGAGSGRTTQYFGTPTIQALEKAGRISIDRSNAWPRASVTHPTNGA